MPRPRPPARPPLPGLTTAPPTAPGSPRRGFLRQAAAASALAGLAGCVPLRTGPGPAVQAAEAARPSQPPGSTDSAPPAPADWQLAADFDPVSAIWLSFGEGHEVLTAGLVAALAPHVALVCVVPDAAAQRGMQALLKQRGLNPPRLRFVQEPLITFFLRDLAVLARRPTGAGVIDFRWTEYGMATWCDRRHGAGTAEAQSCAEQADFSRELADLAVARHLGAPVHQSRLAIEGGGFETNGRGLVIANQPLYASRNPGWSVAQMDAALKRLPGVRQVLWLPEGLAEDPLLRASVTPQHVAWGTGGHSDEFVRFADARTVLLAWPEDADVAAHPVARINRQRMQRNLQLLQGARDADGQPLRVLKVPMPRPLERRVFLSAHADNPRAKEWSAEHFAPREGRWQGQPVLQVATASYLNFVLANGVVVLPDYVPHGTPRAQQARVRQLFEQVFAGRQVAFVDATSANWVGGGPHCATLNVP